MRSTFVLSAVVFGILIGVLMGRGTRMATPVAYQVRVDTLVKQAAQLDTVWRTRKVRYDVRMDRYDTVRVTDTILRNDTIFIPREVADSAISACRALVMTCEAQNANLTVRLAIAESTLAKRDITPLLWSAGIGVILGLILR